MHAVLRQYSGPGAAQLFDSLEERASEIEGIIRDIPGLVSYTLVRTTAGGLSITVCKDKAGADESSRRAAEWVKENLAAAPPALAIAEGKTILQLTK